MWKEMSTGHREGLVQVLRADEGQGGEDEQHLAEPDGGHHDQHPGAVEQPAEEQLGQRADRGRQGRGPATRANQ